MLKCTLILQLAGRIHGRGEATRSSGCSYIFCRSNGGPSSRIDPLEMGGLLGIHDLCVELLVVVRRVPCQLALGLRLGNILEHHEIRHLS